MTTLDLVADSQATLSTTANALKSKVDRARNIVLLLSISGALAAAIAAAADIVDYRPYLTTAGAVFLAIAAAITGRYLSGDSGRRHIRMRSASEALKREAFLYAAGARDYADSATRDAKLTEALNAVNAEIADLSLFEEKATSPGSCPRQALDRDAYLAARVQKQIAYYSDNADRYAKHSGYLHLAEWLLSLLAAVLTAASGVLGRGNFDLAAITAVLTTIGGALLAHGQARKYDEQIVSYRAAAKALRQVEATTPQSADAAALADRAESIISEENGSWRAMFLQ